MLNDFKFVKIIIEEFLEQEHILQRLEFIKSENINDWEKWLQIELYHFMKNHSDVPEVYREVLYACDRRKNHLQNNMYVDLAFRKKGARLNSYIQVELKCDSSAAKLFSRIELDIAKVMSIRPSHDDGRSFWCVGFHTKVEDSESYYINNKIRDYYHKFYGLSKNNIIGYIIF